VAAVRVDTHQPIAEQLITQLPAFVAGVAQSLPVTLDTLFVLPSERRIYTNVQRTHAVVLEAGARCLPNIVQT
jgi:hypothetical protein